MWGSGGDGGARVGTRRGEVSWGRQTGAEVEALVESTSLKDQMRTMALSLGEDWSSGARGRRR